MEIEQTLLVIRNLEKSIRDAEVKRDNSIAFYQRCISEAQEVFRKDTADTRFQLENLIRRLKNYFDENPPTKGKSLKFAGGKFGYSKHTPKFFYDGTPAASDNAALLEFVKNNHAQFVRTKDFVDWDNLRKNLDFDGNNVILTDTGEIIPDMKVQKLPDKFTVKTTDSPLKKALDLETLHALNEKDEQDETTD